MNYNAEVPSAFVSASNVMCFQGGFYGLAEIGFPRIPSEQFQAPDRMHVSLDSTNFSVGEGKAS